MQIEAKLLFTHGLERADLMHKAQRFSNATFGKISLIQALAAI